ncbi:ABC transporter substrate-binding protein, partial [Candidatus Nomurabacteria bacterium]|nr:ABC transporter substrate-binding protein [Candidatus Nomurabacteria bacterium]
IALLVASLLVASIFSSCNSCNKSKNNANELVKINLRLQWFSHSQFAGYIIAKEKGYYKECGLDVSILPGGPDLKPQVTVAAGTDDIGIGVPNQIIAAQSNGVPLVIIAQIFQDSPNRYILKKENSIKQLSDLKGKKVGLWLGGDEVEFIAMLKTQGMTEKDIQLIPQEFSVVPFIKDQYVCSQVTSYGEMNFLAIKGWTKDKLQVLSPKDYNSAILGDLIFCRKDYIDKNKETVTKFLEASIKGWQFCISNPDEALQIILKSNSELSKEEQVLVMQSVIELITTGDAPKYGIGYINPKDLENAERILFESKQIDKHVEVSKVFDNSALLSVKKDIKKIK